MRDAKTEGASPPHFIDEPAGRKLRLFAEGGYGRQEGYLQRTFQDSNLEPSVP